MGDFQGLVVEQHVEDHLGAGGPAAALPAMNWRIEWSIAQRLSVEAGASLSTVVGCSGTIRHRMLY
ncbi:MAG: hypothetical protein QN168_06485 [Armatimonadota bacterium]|nr:hypothetical protein [Armatimonadota bacterium]